MHAQITDKLFDPVFMKIAVAAEKLERFVFATSNPVSVTKRLAIADHFPASWVLRSLAGCGIEKKTRGREFGFHVGQTELQRLKSVNRLAECLALAAMFQRLVER